MRTWLDNCKHVKGQLTSLTLGPASKRAAELTMEPLPDRGDLDRGQRGADRGGLESLEPEFEDLLRDPPA